MKHPHHKGGLALGALTAPLTTPELKLTAEQQAAIDGVLAFCKDPGGGNFCAVVGAAGAGKSLIARLIRNGLMAAGYNVGLCAPTHKACQVLATACGVDKSETVTFASLLGLREKKLKDEIDFVPAPGSKPSKVRTNNNHKTTS